MQDSNSFPFLDTPITFGARSQKLPKLLWAQARRLNQGFHQAQTLEYCSGTWFSTNPAITTAVARQRGTWDTCGVCSLCNWTSSLVLPWVSCGWKLMK
ncbi:hypothetical protein FOVSG1_004550 [Fusarium oxysporum f. sp. vasinfectum]